MNTDNLYKNTLNLLKNQRESLLDDVKKINLDTMDEYKDWIETMVFSEHDIIDELNIFDKIDINDFRDYQHTTVELFLSLVDAHLKGVKSDV